MEKEIHSLRKSYQTIMLDKQKADKNPFMQLSSQVQPYIANLILLLSNVVFYLPRQVSKFFLHK